MAEIFWLQHALILFGNVYTGAGIIEADTDSVCTDHGCCYRSGRCCELEQASGEELNGSIRREGVFFANRSAQISTRERNLSPADCAQTGKLTF